MATPLIILVGADRGGVGKAQPMTANILTPSGWRKMADMRMGTPICGTDGKTYAVSGVFPRGVLPLRRVIFTDGTSVECSPDHLWKTRRSVNFRRDGWIVRRTDDLASGINAHAKKNAYYAYSIPHIAPVQFSSSSPPIDAYTLGALIGDGALSERYQVSLSAPPAKEGIKQKIAAAFGDDRHFSGAHGSASSPQFDIRGGKAKIVEEIRSLGLNLKSKERFVPEIYKTVSVSDRLELLRGLMDTDGSTRDGRTSFSTLSSRLADDMCDLVRSLGGIAVKHSFDRSHEEKGTEYRVNVRMTACPFSIDYKAAAWRPAPQKFGKSIKSIEDIGEAEQQCISTTAPDKLYITDGYNATHNTTTCRALCDYTDQPSMAALPRPRILDSQYPRGDLVQFRPGADVINITDVRDQMRIFDALAGTTIVDVSAGQLGMTLQALDEARLLDDVRGGTLRLALLHVLGPTLSSLREIGDATAMLGASASHFIVKNYINETTFFEWDESSEHARSLAALAHVTIVVPHLDATAAEAVQQAKQSFITFAGSGASRTLRGRVAKWLERTWASFDRVGLGQMIMAQ